MSNNTKLLQAYEELGRLYKDKSNFINLISHEIRTPLNSIIGPVDLLKESVIKKEKLIEDWKYLENNVNQLETYACAAIMIATIQSGSYDIKLQKPHIHNIIESFLKEKKELFSHQNIAVVNDIPKDLKITADTYLIKSLIAIILNTLIEISITETSIKINHLKSKDFNMLVFRVFGFNYEIEKIKKITNINVFEETELENSSGINHALAQWIMYLHNGKIDFTEKDDGFILTLYFPA